MNRAFILIPVCLLCLLASLALALNINFIEKEAKLFPLELGWKTAENLAINTGIKKISSMSLGFFDCVNGQGQIASFTVEKTLCFFKQKNLDFNYYFRELTPCKNSASLKDIAYTNLNYLLSAVSVKSRNVCTSLIISKPNVTFLENLEISQASIAFPAQEIILGSLGYLDLQTNLLISNTASIFAGGDIHISSVHNTSKNKIILNLISPSGTIVINNITGDFEIHAQGKLGVFLPVGQVNLAHKLDLRKASYIVDIGD